MTISDENPLVSIIIPSFNQGMFIRETIESCLTQDYRPLELVIIDGASTDNTVEILHEYDDLPEVRWFSEPDNGVADAVNKGFAIASGEIAGIQSSDDSYLPGAVSQAVACFVEFPLVGLVYADVRNIDVSGNKLSQFQSAPFSIENFLCKSTLILQPAAFFRLPLAQQLGGWNSEYFVCDTELWLRMIFRTEVKKVNALWAVRQMHAVQRNNQGEKIAESYRKMIENSLDIASASTRLKSAARCGRFLTDAVYVSGSDLRKRFLYWRAFFAFPAVLKTQPKIEAQLFPGYWEIKRWHGRLQRALGRIFS